MLKLLKKIHLYGLYKKNCFFLINHVFCGDCKLSLKIKRSLLRRLGYKIGKNVVIISPIYIYGYIEIGDNCWINRGLTIHGNGKVIIEDNCDIGPNVTFLTGGHKIGNSCRRAGQGENYIISVGNGCWIGAMSTFLNSIRIENGVVVASNSVVNKSVKKNSLIAGMPAIIKRDLDL